MIILDLEEAFLVDVDAIRFLAECDIQESTIVCFNVRHWIARETKEVSIPWRQARSRDICILLCSSITALTRPGRNDAGLRRRGLGCGDRDVSRPSLTPNMRTWKTTGQTERACFQRFRNCRD
jgi:hypothetical protein